MGSLTFHPCACASPDVEAAMVLLAPTQSQSWDRGRQGQGRAKELASTSAFFRSSRQIVLHALPPPLSQPKRELACAALITRLCAASGSKAMGVQAWDAVPSESSDSTQSRLRGAKVGTSTSGAERFRGTQEAQGRHETQQEAELILAFWSEESGAQLGGVGSEQQSARRPSAGSLWAGGSSGGSSVRG